MKSPIRLHGLHDPNVVRGSVEVREDGMYTWQMRRGGPRIVSSVPLKEWHWWDYSAPHIIWSWSSWGTQILNHLGGAAAERGWMRMAHHLKRPRKYLKKRGWW